MKILLIGANGQIGHAIYTQLTKNIINPHEIHSWARKDCDFSSPQEVDKRIESLGKIDYIINAMAMTDTAKAELAPEDSYQINALAVHSLAKIANKLNAIIIHFSTDYVFDGDKESSYDETDYTNPLNIYGASKLAGEHLLKISAKNYYILRVSSVYGLHSPYGNFVQKILQKAYSGETISIVYDQFISPTNAYNVGKIVENIIEKKIPFGTYHASDRGKCSWFDFASEILSEAKKYMNLKNVDIKKVSVSDFPSAIRRPQNSALSTNKLSQFMEIPHWKDSLKKHIEVLK